MVSAINSPFHFICRCRGVFSSSGGLGKDCTLSFVFEAILRIFMKSE